MSHTTLNKKVREWSTDLKVLKVVEPLLFDGHIPEVATHIRALGTQQSAVCEILEREARYFEKHAKRMQYKAFREKGYQIGSGVIECVSTGCGA